MLAGWVSVEGFRVNDNFLKGSAARTDAIAKGRSAERGPGCAAVSGLENSATEIAVAALVGFAHSRVDDEVIGRVDGNRADSRKRREVREGRPAYAVIGRLPDAAVGRAQVHGQVSA